MFYYNIGVVIILLIFKVLTKRGDLKIKKQLIAAIAAAVMMTSTLGGLSVEASYSEDLTVYKPNGLSSGGGFRQIHKSHIQLMQREQTASL